MKDEKNETNEKFEKLLESSYNYEEAIQRQSIDHKNIIKMRNLLIDSENVPRAINRKQVNNEIY